MILCQDSKELGAPIEAKKCQMYGFKKTTKDMNLIVGIPLISGCVLGQNDKSMCPEITLKSGSNFKKRRSWSCLHNHHKWEPWERLELTICLFTSGCTGWVIRVAPGG